MLWTPSREDRTLVHVWFSRKLYRLCKVQQLIKFLTFHSVQFHPSRCARSSFPIFRGSGSETSELVVDPWEDPEKYYFVKCISGIALGVTCAGTQTASIHETDGKKQSYPPLLTGYLVLYFQVYDCYLEATVWLILNYFQKAQPHISTVPLTPIQLLGIAE